MGRCNICNCISISIDCIFCEFNDILNYCQRVRRENIKYK